MSIATDNHGDRRSGSRVGWTWKSCGANSANQSLAEATVPAGRETVEHYHRASEEIYRFLSGSGRMRLRDDEVEVRAGDCVVIPPGVRHKLWADEGVPLVVLCCSSPPYSDDDTVLTE